jgi:hypothetical protein
MVSVRESMKKIDIVKLKAAVGEERENSAA